MNFNTLYSQFLCRIQFTNSLFTLIGLKKKKKKNMLNHDILSQSFNTNTSRWEANGQINGFLLTSL